MVISSNGTTLHGQRERVSCRAPYRPTEILTPPDIVVYYNRYLCAQVSKRVGCKVLAEDPLVSAESLIIHEVTCS
jgi:hypothetical protein